MENSPGILPSSAKENESPNQTGTGNLGRNAPGSDYAGSEADAGATDPQRPGIAKVGNTGTENSDSETENSSNLGGHR